jgi:hypothetical protein
MSIDQLQSTDSQKSEYGTYADEYLAKHRSVVAPVREATSPRNRVLAFLAPGWAAFTAAVVGGELRGY